MELDEACLFDSDEEEELEKKYSPEDRKYLFRKELRSMLFGFGDDKVANIHLFIRRKRLTFRVPYDKTLELLEQIVTDYIQQVCLKALAVGKPNRILLEDVHYLIRRDHKKFNRVKELLSMSEELKKARKAFDDAKEI